MTEERESVKLRIIKCQKEGIEFSISPIRTFLIAAAIHKESFKNSINKISCKKGIAIGGYVYDATTDSYQISCSDYIQLGYIPISMLAKVGHWDIRVPLVDKVINKFLSVSQKKDLKNFKAVYGKEDYDINFVQIMDISGW